MTTLIVLAKECLPGRVKTRLSPPFTLEEAAELAVASLHDTLAAAKAVRADRHLLWFDGRAPAAPGFAVGAQPQGGLDERIAAAFDAVRDRALLIGMDTPQVDPAVLQAALDDPTDAAWLGRATDGGFWALALPPLPDRGDLVRGVPMSTVHTGARQLTRLQRAGLALRMLPPLTDVDDVDAAEAVAAGAPATRFAATLRRLTDRPRAVAA